MRTSLILFVALSGAASQAQETAVNLPFSKVSEERSSTSAWSAEFELEARSAADQRNRPTNRSKQSLHEVSANGSYQFDSSLAIHLEFTIEQGLEDSRFLAKQGYARWSPWPDYVLTTIGQQFLPVGMVSPRDNWFSSNPPFMQKMFAASKGIDLGALFQGQPFGSKLFYVEGGIFSGRFVRLEDQQDRAPERAPQVLSLKSHSNHHDVFLTYFEHDLAFYDPVKVYGLGFELRSTEFKGVKATWLTEYWQIQQIQKFGPDERTRAFLTYADIQWWRLKLGLRFSEAQARLATAQGAHALPLEVSKLYLLSVRLHPFFSLQAERVLENQSQVSRDEWVGRALLNWALRD